MQTKLRDRKMIFVDVVLQIAIISELSDDSEYFFLIWSVIIELGKIITAAYMWHVTQKAENIFRVLGEFS